MNNSSIPILLAFDGNFWAPAYATMRSICLSTKRRSSLVFHLCYRDVTAKQRAALDRIEVEFGAKIQWHDLDTHEQFKRALSRLKDSRRLGTVIYARLMIEAFVSESAARAIYLDCDMMVREPIERLMEISLEDKAIGAVRDPWFPRISMGRDIKENYDLFDPADRYFNSGLLVVDLDKWKNSRVWERLLQMIVDGTLDRIYYDQDALNIIFRNNWHELDFRWNVIDPERAHQSISPFILHYTGKRRPWNLLSRVAFARMYRHFMTNEVFYLFWRERLRKRFLSIFRIGVR